MKNKGGGKEGLGNS